MQIRNKLPSYRQQRVATLLNSILMEVLQKGKMLDEYLSHYPITITEVSITRDLKIANCYFLPFNNNGEEDKILAALNRSKYAIRNIVTKKIQLKYSPELRFHYDHRFNNTYKVDELIRQLKNDPSI